MSEAVNPQPPAENDRYGFLSSDGYPEEGPNPLIKPPPSAENDAARKALEGLWGCGPGQMITDASPYPGSDGEPYEIAVGQLCQSNAHTYAYWDGTCEFASHAARAVSSVIPPAADAAEGADQCERCEGTGDRYGRAYGAKTPCPDCGGTGVLSPAVVGTAD